MASGMPTMLRNMGMAVSTWPIAIQIPATMNQMTLPSTVNGPVTGRASTTMRPNGHSAYPAIRKDAMPNGMVTISRQHTTPAST